MRKLKIEYFFWRLKIIGKRIKALEVETNGLMTTSYMIDSLIHKRNEILKKLSKLLRV